MAGCSITVMTDDCREPVALWHKPSTKNVAILALIWFGEAFLILMFVRWVLHASAFLYLLMIPWAFIGVIVAARPNWLMRMMLAVENKTKRDMERLDKWTPPLP